MKVTRKEALTVSRGVLTKAERERMDERMELKRIEEMTPREVDEEVSKRLEMNGIHYLRDILVGLRNKDVGTENLKPPEPDWKRWRKWPDEKPLNLSRVEWKRSGLVIVTGYYTQNVKYPFASKDGSDGESVTEWRYLEPPIEWRNVERDGEPTEEGWYWVRHTDNRGSILHFPRGGGVWYDVIAYCPIAPPPPYEEPSQ